MRRRKPSIVSLAAVGAAVATTVFIAGFYGPDLIREARAAPLIAANPTGSGALMDPLALWAIDGDTITRRDGERIRIANIDTPEMPPKARCPSEGVRARAAKQRLSDILAQADTVAFFADARERDRYGRLLGRLEVDQTDVGETLVREGHARPWRGRREPWC